MSGWRIITARRVTDDEPTADEAEEEVSKMADHHVDAWDRAGDLVVSHLARDADPLMRFARRHADKFDVVALVRANDTDDSASVQFYEANDGGLDAIDGASDHVGPDQRFGAHFSHAGLRAVVNG